MKERRGGPGGADGRASSHDTAVGKTTLTGMIQRRARGAAGMDAEVPATGAGEALPSSTRGRFEASLGADLGGVRVHSGSASAESADALGARAYTVGQDIHFGAGEYAPGTAEGDRLLAHEVAHTVQQAGAPPSTQAKLEVSEPGDALEADADRAAERMLSGEPTGALAQASSQSIGRQVHGATPAPAAHPAPQPGQPAAQPGQPAQPGPAAPPARPLREMFTVDDGQPTVSGEALHRGHADAGQATSNTLIEAPRISASGTIRALPGVDVDPPVKAGIIQTMTSSTRTAIYTTDGTPTGQVVAEQRSNIREAHRDARWDDNNAARRPTTTITPPFSQDTQDLAGHEPRATFEMMDQPQGDFPSSVADGRLAQIRGSESFVTSFGVKRGEEIAHLKAFTWSVPWDCRVENGSPVGGGTIAPPRAAADGMALNNEIAIAASADAEHFAFTSVEHAMRVPTIDLLQMLPAALRNDRAGAAHTIVQALTNKNITVHGMLRVILAADFGETDEVTVTARGHRDVSFQMSLAQGSEGSFTIPLSALVNYDGLAANSAIIFWARDGGTISHDAQEVRWYFPFAEAMGTDGEGFLMQGPRDNGRYRVMLHLEPRS